MAQKRRRDDTADLHQASELDNNPYVDNVNQISTHMDLVKFFWVDILPSTVPTYVPTGTFLNCTHNFLRFSYTLHCYCTISSGPFADDSID